MGRSQPEFLDAPPLSQGLTDYDRAHLVLYLRLLDAAREGADWREVSQVLFALDPGQEPERCRQVHEAHLARAQWMTDHGYRELLRQAEHQ
jgi:hypothetical protein